MRYFANGWTKEKVREQVKKFNNGKRASDKTGRCLYEAKDGNRCFIGAFIPEGHQALDAKCEAGELMCEYSTLQKLMPFDNYEDLQDFQLCHDIGSKNFDDDTYTALDDFLKECSE